MGLIGSCTNSSYEDMGRSASLIKQALGVWTGVRVPANLAHPHVIPLRSAPGAPGLGLGLSLQLWR